MFDDSGRWGEPPTVRAGAVDEFEVVGELHDVAVINFSKVFGDICIEPMSVYCYKGCREGNEKRDACGAAGHAQNEFFVDVDGVASGINFGLLWVPILGEPINGFYELGVC